MTRLRLAVALLALGACDRSPVEPAQYVIKVDSISAPASVGYAEPFTVTFHGTVGGSSCYSLRRVEREYSAGAVDFVFIGERCTSGNGRLLVVALNQPELVRISRLGPVTIRVRQPDGSILTEDLVVR
jgi:hypothetical protein